MLKKLQAVYKLFLNKLNQKHVKISKWGVYFPFKLRNTKIIYEIKKYELMLNVLKFIIGTKLLPACIEISCTCKVCMYLN